MIPPFWGGPQWLGLDIQADGIKAVQARRVAGVLTVSRFANFPLAEGVMLEGKVQVWRGLEQALRDMVQAWRLKGCFVVTCLPVQLVRTQKITLPSAMTGAELERAISVQLLRELVGVMDGMQLDYSHIPSEDKRYQKLIVTAVRAEYVQQFAQTFASAGLQLKVIDVDAYALQRIYQTQSTILFVAGDQARFIVMDRHSVLFQQQWIVSSAEEFYREFKSALQLCRALHGESSVKIVQLCGEFRLFALEPEELNQISDCIVIVQEEWSGVCFVSAGDAEKCHSEYAIALGLLQREIPRWL